MVINNNQKNHAKLPSNKQYEIIKHIQTNTQTHIHTKTVAQSPFLSGWRAVATAIFHQTNFEFTIVNEWITKYKETKPNQMNANANNRYDELSLSKF